MYCETLRYVRSVGSISYSFMGEKIEIVHAILIRVQLTHPPTWSTYYWEAGGGKAAEGCWGERAYLDFKQCSIKKNDTKNWDYTYFLIENSPKFFFI
jgi:hypothetical protein